MTFVIYVSFDNIKFKDTEKKYSLIISDTILINNDGKLECLTKFPRA